MTKTTLITGASSGIGTACGEVLGTYIVDYKGERFRLSLEQTYTFLKYIQEN